MSQYENDPRYHLLVATLEAEGTWVTFTAGDGGRSIRPKNSEELAEIVLDALDKFAGDEAFRNPESGEYFVSLRIAHEKALRRKLAYKVSMMQTPSEHRKSVDARMAYLDARDAAAAIVQDEEL